LDNLLQINLAIQVEEFMLCGQAARFSTPLLFLGSAILGREQFFVQYANDKFTQN